MISKSEMEIKKLQSLEETKEDKSLSLPMDAFWAELCEELSLYQTPSSSSIGIEKVEEIHPEKKESEESDEMRRETSLEKTKKSKEGDFVHFHPFYSQACEDLILCDGAIRSSLL
jgi:hypothetical protein